MDNNFTCSICNETKPRLAEHQGTGICRACSRQQTFTCTVCNEQKYITQKLLKVDICKQCKKKENARRNYVKNVKPQRQAKRDELFFKCKICLRKKSMELKSRIKNVCKDCYLKSRRYERQRKKDVIINIFKIRKLKN
jgi:hypothetical protein